MTTESLEWGIWLESGGDFGAETKLFQKAEALGFEMVWIREGAGNPFFALTLAAATTRRIKLGAVISAFPRSPMVTAQIAWDLARQSDGRFMLGLSAPASSEKPPGHLPRMREYIESLRAIWAAFQTDARLRYRGKHYSFRLMAPFFNPGPIEHPDIPIFLQGESDWLCALAGETCAGLALPDLEQSAGVVAARLAAWKRGLARRDRQIRPCTVIAPVHEADAAAANKALGQLPAPNAGVAKRIRVIAESRDPALLSSATPPE